MRMAERTSIEPTPQEVQRHPDMAAKSLILFDFSVLMQVKRSAEGGPVTRSWLFRFKYDGRSSWMGLGSARDVTLADARQRAAECRRQLAMQQNPLAERKAKRMNAVAAQQRTLSFDKCAEAYIAAHPDGWRNAKHAGQWESTLRLHASPVIGKLAVDQVDLQHVLRILEPIWRTRTETASRVRGRVESILDWATVRGLRRGDNPARWRGHLDQLLPLPSKVAQIEHHAAIPFAEAAAFLQRLIQMPGMGAQALRFLILTAARSGEVRGAVRSEIDDHRARDLGLASDQRLYLFGLRLMQLAEFVERLR